MSQLRSSIIAYVCDQNEKLRKIRSLIRANEVYEAIKLVDSIEETNRYLIKKMTSDS